MGGITLRGQAMTVRTLIGDVRDKLRELADESVHCVVTSPPYWGLRDYGVKGQLGLEPTLAEHVATMADIFDEVRRVLRKDGTLWLNYGDSYAASVNGRSAADTKDLGNDDRTFRDKPFSTVGPIYRQGCSRLNGETNDRQRNRNGMGGFDGGTLKPKDLCGVPWRVAFALQERGWWLRQDIIWAKPNAMPESVTDRCTKAHEFIFLLAKSSRYFFDSEAISEPCVQIEDAIEFRGGSYTHDEPRPRIQSGNKHRLDDNAFRTRPPGRAGANGTFGRRNRRSVWTIATAPYAEAHFATFPPELAEICIKAGTSQKGCCEACGAPWVRQIERTPAEVKSPASGYGIGAGRNDGGRSQLIGACANTLGWSPSCSCSAIIIPCTVLDPFGGAGTTGLVADRLQRNAILIELNPEYAGLAGRRIEGDAPLFAEVVNA